MSVRSRGYTVVLCRSDITRSLAVDAALTYQQLCHAQERWNKLRCDKMLRKGPRHAQCVHTDTRVYAHAVTCPMNAITAREIECYVHSSNEICSVARHSVSRAENLDLLGSWGQLGVWTVSDLKDMHNMYNMHIKP